MEYKLYDASFVPQLSRILGSASDDKAAYVISLAQGKTEQDLLVCLNTRPSGAGYYFDTSRLTSDLGVLLGTGNDCTRNLVHDILSFSKCNITCNVVGTPTHVILGGIAPFVFEIGKDVKLLSATTGTTVDVTGIGSVVSVAAFKLKFTAMDFVKFTQLDIGAIWYRQSYGEARWKEFDDYQKQLVRQIGTKDFQIDFSCADADSGGRTGLLCLTSELGSNAVAVDGLSVRYASTGMYTSRFYLERAGTTTSEIFMTAPGRFNAVPITIKRINGITKIYADNVELPLYAYSDTSLTTPVQYSLAYDLSNAVVCRMGKFEAPAGESNSNGRIFNMTVKQLF